ncbi:hypothetical protein, partial [Neisseria meningitidis]|uniref:hypothetical protein n=1 Tax=Neisseria meningitidis TaxID=487 RepID=UPI00195E8421
MDKTVSLDFTFWIPTFVGMTRKSFRAGLNRWGWCGNDGGKVGCGAGMTGYFAFNKKRPLKRRGWGVEMPSE